MRENEATQETSRTSVLLPSSNLHTAFVAAYKNMSTRTGMLTEHHRNPQWLVPKGTFEGN